MERKIGKVKWFNDKSGFGFITPDDGSREVFVHQTAIINEGGYRTLMPGESVSFELLESEKGPKAMKVRRA